MAKRQKRRRVCYLCGKNGSVEPLERHHVFGGPYRWKSELYGAEVDLCAFSCHREGKDSVHRNAMVSRALKEEFQLKIMAEQDWDVPRFVEEFGKNYT